MQIGDVEIALAACEQNGIPVLSRDSEGTSTLVDFAKDVGLVLPKEVMEFYSQYKLISYPGIDVISVARASDSFRELQSMRRRAPKNFLPIIEDDAGGYYFVVCGEVGKPKPSDFGRVLYVHDLNYAFTT